MSQLRATSTQLMHTSPLYTLITHPPSRCRRQRPGNVQVMRLSTTCSNDNLSAQILIYLNFKLTKKIMITREVNSQHLHHLNVVIWARFAALAQKVQYYYFWLKIFYRSFCIHWTHCVRRKYCLNQDARPSYILHAALPHMRRRNTAASQRQTRLISLLVASLLVPR